MGPTVDTTITKEFFLKEPRARAIREAAITFIRRFESLAEANGIDRAFLASQLEEAREVLIGLGVQPGMHEGRSFEFFKRRPIEAAEFAAGQLLKEDGEGANNAPLEQAYFCLNDVGSYSLPGGGESAILSGQNPFHGNVLARAVSRDVIRIVTLLLDANGEIYGT